VTILVLSNTFDPHVAAVEIELRKKGQQYLRLDTDTLDKRSSVRFAVGPSPTPQVRISCGGQCLELSEITAVWYRRPELPAFSYWSSSDARQFARHETQAVIDNLVALLDLQGVRWLSRPEAIRRAGNKIRQLADARQLGFEVPPTLVSRDSDEIREFAGNHANTIAKLVSKGVPRTPNIEDQYTVFTTLLSAVDLANDAKLAACPAQYQLYVEKAFEVRVTVVGSRVLACRIDSQASDKTRTDWRNYDLQHTPHSVYLLDDSIADKCRALVKLYDLAFGAIDLIVTPEGQTVFLELNPNGQWLWLAELTGIPIGDAIANYLENGD